MRDVLVEHARSEVTLFRHIRYGGTSKGSLSRDMAQVVQILRASLAQLHPQD
jgi:hypothetical protein